jgi:hypothetical protein
VFDLRSGEIVEIHLDEAGPVCLMSAENLMRYRLGRDDYVAEGSLPFASPIELVARNAGQWHLVSEQPLSGMYRLRRGVETRTGTLRMTRG